MLNKHIRNIISLCVVTFSFQGYAQTREVPYTLEDRDRSIQILEKLNSQQQQINDLKQQINDLKQQINEQKQSTQQQFDEQKQSTRQQINDLKESTQQQINDLRNLFFWGFGIVISLILFLFGFIIWDRRTVTEPIKEKTQTVIQVLREFSRDHPKLSEILRSHGVL